MCEIYEFTVSNTTVEEIDALIAGNITLLNVDTKSVIHNKAKKNSERCIYALNTGEKAFVNLPCRGNKILCQHPDNKGFVSYTKACNPGICKFFKQKEEETP